MELTQAKLKEILEYNPETGEFRWKINQNSNAMAGAVAGSYDTNGYCRVRVFRKLHMVHRLAWLYMTGEWPERQIDHDNTVRSDNRWKNLRAATQAQNSQNSGARTAPRLKGVTWNKKEQRWLVRIDSNGVRHNGGYHDALLDAAAAAISLRRRLHGDFARCA